MSNTVDSQIYRRAAYYRGLPFFVLEVLVKWLNKKLGYRYDAGKKMWYRYRSDCHGATTTAKALLKSVPLKVSFSRLSDKDKDLVTYKEYCDFCQKPCKLVWKIKYV